MTETLTPRKFDCYECDEDDCNRLDESFICKDAVSCWKSTVREDDGTERNARGCIGNWQQVRLICTGSRQYHIECCKGTLCNGAAFPTLQPPEIREPSMSSIMLITAIMVPLLVIAFVILAVAVYRRHNKRCRAPLKKCCQVQLKEQYHSTEMESEANEPPQASSSNVAATPSYSSPELKITSTGDSTLKAYLDGQSLTSGSGSGLPLLTQRTFSKQISLIEQLGHGRFGCQRELWLGVWQGESVAVKVFSSRSETLWARETEVYTRWLPSKHDNILGYLGSDMTSVASCTQLWLVTHYHPNGSLRNCLKERPLQHSDMLNMCLTLARGLLYLHTEIHGTKGKMSMAHRNLSSRSVFVKNDGSCAIADFGHAVTQERLEDNTFLEYTSKRYMSPELLERTFDPQSMESFRQADIYSLSLVFWEICRRCVSNEGIVLDYAAPYSEFLYNGDHEPTLEEMYQLIVTDQYRSEIPQHWQSDQTLAGMGTMIKECWQIKPAARLTILRVKKTLIKLASNNSDIDLSLD